jgi:hypothetical protein
MKAVNCSMKTSMLQRQLCMVTRKLENTFQLPSVERDFLMRGKSKDTGDFERTKGDGMKCPLINECEDSCCCCEDVYDALDYAGRKLTRREVTTMAKEYCFKRKVKA